MSAQDDVRATEGQESDSTLAPPDQRIDIHSCYLVYPFCTEVDPGSKFYMWSLYTDRLGEDKYRDRELEDSYAFLPSVRASMFSTITNSYRDRDRRSSSYKAPSEKLQGCTRLTLSKSIKAFRLISVTAYDADEIEHEIEVSTDWIDVFLYPGGFGFLVYKMDLHNVSVEEAGTLHRSLKKVHFRGRLRVNTAKLASADGVECKWPELLTDLLSEFEVNINSEFAHIFGSSFRVMSLSVGSELVDDKLRYGNIIGSEEGHLITLLTGEELSTISHPGDDLLSSARNYGRLKYWRDWSGMFLWDDVAFIARRTPFTVEHLKHNVEALYVPLFVFVLFQQVTIHDISNRLTALAVDAPRNRDRVLTKLEALNADVVYFRSNYMFWEVSRAPVVSALFSRLAMHFGTEKLFDAIERDIERLYSQERTVSQERLARLISLVTVVTLPVTILVTIFSTAISDVLSHSVWQRFVFALVTSALFVLMWLLATRGGSVQRLRERLVSTVIRRRAVLIALFLLFPAIYVLVR